MSNPEPQWGFWIPVTDTNSANYAAKMSGLPVFLLGVLFIPILITAFIKGFNFILVGFLLTSVFFLYSGLKIRGGDFRTLPISVGAWLLLAVISIGFDVKTGITITLWSSMLNLLIGLIACCGLRGWWWLRHNKSEL